MEAAKKNRRTRRFGSPMVPFDRNNFDSRFFLSPLPSDSLLAQSYPIRETLSSIMSKQHSDRQMVTTEANFHLLGSSESTGLIQFRQVSDMWLTEVKGILQQMPAKKRLFLIVHESKEPANEDCSNLGNHLNPFKQPHGDPAAFSDVKTKKLNNHLGDLIVLNSDGNGYTIVKYHSLHISLFNDASSIVGHAIAIHEITDEKELDGPIVACGNINANVKSMPAKFQKTKKPKRSFLY